MACELELTVVRNRRPADLSERTAGGARTSRVMYAMRDEIREAGEVVEYECIGVVTGAT